MNKFNQKTHEILSEFSRKTQAENSVLEQAKIGDYENVPSEYHEKLARNMAHFILGFAPKIERFNSTKIQLYNMKDLLKKDEKLANEIAKKVSEITKNPENNMLTYELEDVFKKKSLIVAITEDKKIAGFAGRDRKTYGGGNWENSEIGTMYTADEFRKKGIASTIAMVLTGESHEKGALANMWTNEKSYGVAQSLNYKQVSSEQQKAEKFVPDEQIFVEWPEGQKYFDKTGEYPPTSSGEEKLNWRDDMLWVKVPEVKNEK